MIRRPTWILLGVFVVLLAGTVYLSRTGNLSFLPEETPVPTKSPLFSLDTGQITAIEVDKRGDQVVRLDHTADAGWSVTQPPGSQVAPEEVETAVVTISTWTVQNELSVPPPMDAMGLATPAYVITFSTSNGQTRFVNVGNLTPTSSGYYVQVDGGPPVVIGKANLDPLLQLWTTALQPTPTSMQDQTSTIPVETPPPTETSQPV
jgi:hypothetical protein